MFATYHGQASLCAAELIVDAFTMPGVEGIEFDPPRVNIEIRPADFT